VDRLGKCCFRGGKRVFEVTVPQTGQGQFNVATPGRRYCFNDFKCQTATGSPGTVRDAFEVFPEGMIGLRDQMSRRNGGEYWEEQAQSFGQALWVAGVYDISK